MESQQETLHTPHPGIEAPLMSAAALGQIDDIPSSFDAMNTCYTGAAITGERSILEPCSGTEFDTKCFLLDLPAEIRLVIFEYATTEQHSIRLPLWPKYGRCSIPSMTKRNLQPALAMTCRTIRRECLPAYYSKNIFRMVKYTGGERFTADDIKSFGACADDVKLMKRIELERCRCGTGYLIDFRCNIAPGIITHSDPCSDGCSALRGHCFQAVEGIVKLYKGRAVFKEGMLRWIMRNM